MYPYYVNQYAFKQPEFSYAVPSSYGFSAPGPNAATYSLLLIISLPLFVVWDVLLTLGNAGTVFKLFELGNLLLTIAAVFLIIATLIKVYTMAVALMTYLAPDNNNLQTWEDVQVITIFMNAVGGAYILIIGINMLLPGTLIGFSIDFLLHAATAGLSSLLWKEYHLTYRKGWYMVPQYALTY